MVMTPLSRVADEKLPVAVSHPRFAVTRHGATYTDPSGLSYGSTGGGPQQPPLQTVPSGQERLSVHTVAPPGHEDPAPAQ